MSLKSTVKQGRNLVAKTRFVKIELKLYQTSDLWKNEGKKCEWKEKKLSDVHQGNVSRRKDVE